MNLNEAKKEVDRTLASLFYERMRGIDANDSKAGEIYKQAAKETSELVMHMKNRLDILFGQNTDALAEFLHDAGITPKQDH